MLLKKLKMSLTAWLSDSSGFCSFCSFVFTTIKNHSNYSNAKNQRARTLSLSKPWKCTFCFPYAILAYSICWKQKGQINNVFVELPEFIWQRNVSCRFSHRKLQISFIWQTLMGALTVCRAHTEDVVNETNVALASCNSGLAGKTFKNEKCLSIYATINCDMCQKGKGEGNLDLEVASKEDSLKKCYLIWGLKWIGISSYLYHSLMKWSVVAQSCQALEPHGL